MKRDWYYSMYKLGKETGYGMQSVIMIERSSADAKASARVKRYSEGKPEHFIGEHYVVPILNRRGKVMRYTMKNTTELGL